MSNIGLFFGVIYLILMVFCAFKESSVTAPYKQFNIYGRWRAFFAFDFTGLGAVLIAGAILDILGYWLIITKPILKTLGTPLMFLCGLASFVLGISIYVYTYKKCPKDWRNKLIINMLITALGTIMKVCFFWTMFFLKIWSYTLPEYITGSDGKKYIRHRDGNIYTDDGKRVGNETGDGKFTVLKDQYGNLIENEKRF